MTRQSPPPMRERRVWADRVGRFTLAAVALAAVLAARQGVEWADLWRAAEDWRAQAGGGVVLLGYTRVIVALSVCGLLVPAIPAVILASSPFRWRGRGVVIVAALLAAVIVCAFATTVAVVSPSSLDAASIVVGALAVAPSALAGALTAFAIARWLSRLTQVMPARRGSG